MKEIKYLVLSDIHLGHNVNKAENIFNNLISFFSNHHEVIKDIKILFIAGDVFDKYLPTYSLDYNYAISALTFLVNWCKTHNVKLRILEGTPSHDWKQSGVISKIISDLKFDLDYRYVSDLEIEVMTDLDLKVLYVPDEYKHKAEETFKDVKTLLKSKGLDQVDITIMHGHFNYQLPMIKLPTSHNEKDYLDITKHYISVGHVHTHSSYSRILAQGSFDRLVHGEEEPKGGILCKIRSNTDEWLFLENKRSMLFKTFDLTNTEDDQLLTDINKELRLLPKGSSIRFIVKDKDKILNKLKEFKKNTEGYNIKFMVPDVKKLSITDKIEQVLEVDSFSITPENIENLIKSELKIKLDNNEIDLNLYEKARKEIVTFI